MRVDISSLLNTLCVASIDAPNYLPTLDGSTRYRVEFTLTLRVLLSLVIVGFEAMDYTIHNPGSTWWYLVKTVTSSNLIQNGVVHRYSNINWIFIRFVNR